MKLLYEQFFFPKLLLSTSVKPMQIKSKLKKNYLTPTYNYMNFKIKNINIHIELL